MRQFVSDEHMRGCTGGSRRDCAEQNQHKYCVFVSLCELLGKIGNPSYNLILHQNAILVFKTPWLNKLSDKVCINMAFGKIFCYQLQQIVLSGQDCSNLSIWVHSNSMDLAYFSLLVELCIKNWVLLWIQLLQVLLLVKSGIRVLLKL